MARQKYAKKTKFSQIFFSTPTQKLNVWFLCPLPKVVKFITPGSYGGTNLTIKKHNLILENVLL